MDICNQHSEEIVYMSRSMGGRPRGCPACEEIEELKSAIRDKDEEIELLDNAIREGNE